MSKTPRTDEHLRRKEENGHTVIVSSEFVRQLETELAEARAEIDRLERRVYQLKKDNIESLDLLAADTALQNRLADQIESKDKQIIEARAEIERLKSNYIDVGPVSMSQDKRVDLVLSVTGRYYAAKCNHCGWVGSSEFCIENRLADDFEVLCPVCHRHISDDDPVAEDISKFLNKESVKIVQRKNAIIAQMREALRIVLRYPMLPVSAALEAAKEEGE